MKRTDWPFKALLGATAGVLIYLVSFVFLRAPEAQPAAGGLAQKIFYFHVPAAYAMYVGGTVCLAASAAYLLRPGDLADAWARAGAEAAVLFGSMVLASGPLWAKKAWGVYWTWEPRLTTLLLSVLIYAAIVVIRAFVGAGQAERKFAAAFGVLGTANLPLIHVAVHQWGGNHPTVIGRGGGGLSADMRHALIMGFLTMTLLAAVVLWMRARLALAVSRCHQLEELAANAGIEE
ncbi:MAG: cytochrome c biogenesis protein CcsA [Polyangiaceae bacterium]|nr:cytochrome c biogenesis protein CcsA [Polyangiaceae bacterium]